MQIEYQTNIIWKILVLNEIFCIIFYRKYMSDIWNPYSISIYPTNNIDLQIYILNNIYIYNFDFQIY